MVMVKNKSSYTYGNVAYDFETEVKREEKNLKNIKPNNKKKTKAKLKLMVYVAGLFLLSFLSLCRFASIIRITNNIYAVKKEIKQVEKSNEDLKVAMAKYNNIKNIESVAVSKGMVVPSSDCIVYLDVQPLTSLEEKEVKYDKYSFVKRILGLIY